MSEKSIIVVQGPTASGKTALAIALAKQYQTEIISFDSRQFYKELAIGVARPNAQELAQVKHHLIASHSVHEPLNANSFVQHAQPILDKLLAEKGAAVLVGGSALFADALLLGLDPLPHDPVVQAKWQTVFENDGLEALQVALAQQDPAFYREIDTMNPTRLMRALEINELTGQSNVSLRKGPRKDPPHVARLFINWPRVSLYERINLRVDQMLAEGLAQEAREFFPDGAQLQALQTVGYREFFDYFEGKTTQEEAIEKIKQHSRNYAKRQLTWLARYEQIIALDPATDSELLATALVKIG
ncbi:MAG: tRNA (adenosine(37)-N6)-dimethylallyltransferase MiaA [Crocinitomicaceae bacterium]|jgi:tRNA dimethylallyltransferase|nr:tRNA (adenosine(37)-N6)-dimethylallyltransferase MiaA [Crocinitomicaceae bacterium]MDP4724224.1 tRNA (adenosine(37)-N6)-dimethylallyltransferase MiaA [Crocinitomicaceae bacterium]MDP4739658.1 tRNA (adenosine(37)-N6)-dimethylallyltransferase MiaA [Crocinitomicaceae bacterium]MDP4799386.1 tRNA (adenosine(37)-N6)-dimethylallyltransferase MiaA [Crocinitomicaceae bacterium]MDP4805874.1 tRNA (adenosine(37)-N6)-dimethylallyltransferase MiaA [Crocinitomicaceae bacterium]